MRRIAVINQKGGVGKTTTCANLGAALARLGRRVVLFDMDAQANLSMHLGVEVGEDQASTYGVLVGKSSVASALRPTRTPDLFLVPAHLELSGAELELASTFGRETLLRIAIEDWEREARAERGEAPADYVLFDCPPSLGLLSINALAAASEVLVALQTEFFALQGMSTLVDVVQLLKRRLHPALEVTGILPCLYDNRKRLAREVLAEIRTYFPGKVYKTPIRANVKLAEAPSFGQTIFEYAPESNGALDYLRVAEEVLDAESRDAELSAKPRKAWSVPRPAAAPEVETEPEEDPVEAPSLARRRSEAEPSRGTPSLPRAAPAEAAPPLAQSGPEALEDASAQPPREAAAEAAPALPALAPTEPEPAPGASAAAEEAPPEVAQEPEPRPADEPEPVREILPAPPPAREAWVPRSTFRIPFLAASEPELEGARRAVTALATALDPAPIEDRLERWAAEERLGAEPVRPESAPAPAERTYVLYPTPPPRPVQAAERFEASLAFEPQGGERPNDLISLCLRSLRSLWRR